MIDPNISLQVKQPDAFDPTKWQNLANLRTANDLQQQQLANSQAQNPGIVAQSSSAVSKASNDAQDAAANQHILDLAASGKYTTKDADGNTTIDYPKLYGDAATKYPQQATKMAASNLDTEYKKLANEQQAALASGSRIDLAQKNIDFGNKAVQTGAQIIAKSSMPEADKPAALQSLIERQAAHYPTAFANSPYLSMTPATDPQTGQPIPGAPPKPKFTGVLTGSSVKSIADGSMSPQEAAAQGRADTAMSLPYIKDVATTNANVTSASDKANAATKVIAGKAYDTDLQAALSMQGQMGDLIGKGIVGNAYTTALEKAKQGPGSAVIAQYQKGVDAYNAMHPDAPIDVLKLGVMGTNAKLQAEARRNQQTVDSFQRLIDTNSPSAAVGATAPGGAAPVATQPLSGGAPAVVRVKGPDGRAGNIPASRLQEYLKNGYTQL